MSILGVRVGAFAISFASLAFADFVTINNASFELQSPSLTSGGFTTDTITSWTVPGGSGGAGAFQPIVGTEVNSVPDGVNVAYSTGSAINQALNAVLLANTTYTLSVDVGQRLDCCGFAGYDIYLMAGPYTIALNRVLASDVLPADRPSPGNFLLETASFTTTSLTPGLGDQLLVGFRSDDVAVGTEQTLFDKVSLQDTAVVGVTATPEPAHIWLLTSFLLGLVLLRRYHLRAS